MDANSNANANANQPSEPLQRLIRLASCPKCLLVMILHDLRPWQDLLQAGE